MEGMIWQNTLKRLDVQGFDSVEVRELAEVAPWLRLAFFLCSALAGIGTALASTPILLALVPIAALGALFPVHPFDLIYNLGIRHLTGTGPLPRRRAQNRFACGLATVWLIATILAFESGLTVLGYGLGFALTGVGLLVGTTDICIPSMIYRAMFGGPMPRESSSVDPN